MGMVEFLMLSHSAQSCCDTTSNSIKGIFYVEMY